MYILKLAAITILLIAALVTDIKACKIKNFATVGFALAGSTLNFIEMGMNGLLFSFMGWIVPIILLFALYALKVLGAGDIKLFAAFGAIMGCSFTIYNIAFSFVAGGVIGIVILAARRNFLERFRYLANYLRSCCLTCRILPYNELPETSGRGVFRFTYAIIPGTLIQVVFMNW